MKLNLKKLVALLLAAMLMLSMYGLNEESIVVGDNIAVEEASGDGIPAVGDLDLDGQLDILDSMILYSDLQTPVQDQATAPEEINDDEAASNALVKKVRLGVNEKYIIDTRSFSGKLTFKSSKPDVANVSKKGIIKGKKVGTAKISITTAAGKKYKITVTVAKAPTKVTLNKKSLLLKVGETFKLKAKLPSKTASNKITWTSSNKNVATVSNSGKVKAKAAGSATITVKTFNGKKMTCKVTVKSAEPKVTPTPVPTAEPTVEPTIQPTVEPTPVPTVEPTIQPTVEPTAQPTSVPVPTRIELDDNDALMLAGTSFYLHATVYPENVQTTLTWSSSNESKISVDQDGCVKANGYGKAIITVTTDNGPSATCAVESTDMEVGVFIDEPISKVIDRMPISLLHNQNTYHSLSLDVGFIVNDSNIVTAVVIQPSNPVGRFEIFGIWAEMESDSCRSILSELGFSYIGKTSSGMSVYERGSYRIGITYDDKFCVKQCMLTRRS